MTVRSTQPAAVTLLAVCASLAAATAFADCELLSVADAEFLLGPNVTDLSGDDAATQCMFLGGSPQGTLIVQFNPRDFYDLMTILQPHTPADVGEQGRTNIDDAVTALQFVQGEKSVTMSVRLAESGEPDFLDKLVTVGQRLAARLE